MPHLFRLLVVIACAVVGSLLAASAEAKRVAFVVGNADYSSLAPLKNPQRDAAAVADRLKDLGFEVTELFNADAFSLNRAAASFVAKANGADLALFYFAGHGVQLFDRNFLLSRDADPKSASRPQDLGLDLTSFMVTLQGSGAVRLALLIDACRDNPLTFEDTVRLLDRLRGDPTFKSASTTPGRGTRGLATIDLGRQEAKSAAQTLLFFAAQPGAVSFDGAGLNSYFVEGLKEGFARPDRGLKEILEGAIGYVRTVTGNRQVPQLVSDWAAELPMGASTSAARIEFKVYGKDAGERTLTPAERDLVLRAAAFHSSFRGDFIAKVSIGDNFSFGLSEEEKAAAKLGPISSFSLSYDLDRDGQEETIHVYPGQVGLVIALETAGVKALVGGGGGETLEIALRDINGDRKPEIWIVDADEEGKSRMWGKLSILEYKGLPNLADLRRGNTGLFHDGSKAFRTLLRTEAGWNVSVATDHSIKVCAGSNCHTIWSYAFDGERFHLLMDGSMEPTTARALPFKDMKDRATRMVSHLLKSTTPLVPYGWKVSQPKAGSAKVIASVGGGTEIAFECGTGYFGGLSTSLTVRGREAQVDETLAHDNFANAPALIDGKACELSGGHADIKTGTIKLFLGETGAADGCWTRLQKASLVTFPVVLSQSKSLLQLRMTEAGRYLAAAQRTCSGDRSVLSDPPIRADPVPPPVPTQNMRARIERFITERYLPTSSGVEITGMVAASVDFYGKRRTRDEVVREKLDYFSKWPYRTYNLLPETLVVSPDPGQPGRWNAEFQYTFRVSGQKGVRSGRGVARLGLVSASGGGFHIVSESGEVLERY